MKEPFRLTQDGMKAWNSLPAHLRPQPPVRLTTDGLRALQAMPAHYRPRLHWLPPT